MGVAREMVAKLRARDRGKKKEGERENTALEFRSRFGGASARGESEI